jgi:hypothetical protein
MTYDEALADRIRTTLRERDDVVEKSLCGAGGHRQPRGPGALGR